MKGIRAAVLSWVVLALALIFAPTVLRAQNVVPPGDQSVLHRIGNRWEAPAFAFWRTQIVTGNSSTGSQTIIVKASGLKLNDGYTMPCNSTFCDPFNTATPITVGAGSVQETVTPSAVSVAACPASAISSSADFCASVTATFSNVHGYPEPVVSGDAGIEEAVTDAGWNGGGAVEWFVDAGNNVITGGSTTTLATKVPSTFFIEGASAIVETTITTATTWEVGVSGSPAAFCASNTTLTAGTQCKTASVATVGTGSTTLVGILITPSTTPGAGALKVRAWGLTPVSSAF